MDRLCISNRELANIVYCNQARSANIEAESELLLIILLNKILA